MSNDLLDKQELKVLINSFAKGINEASYDILDQLWIDEGEWIFESPINEKYKGKELICKTAIKKLSSFSHFDQKIDSYTLDKINDNKYTGTVYISEFGVDSKGGKVFYSAKYVDTYMKSNNRWLFQSRVFYLRNAYNL